MIKEELGEISTSTQNISKGKRKLITVMKKYLPLTKILKKNKAPGKQAINITKKYLAGNIDAKQTLSQINKWQKTNEQTVELLLIKLTNKSQDIS
ncbi:13661_t:CDS:2 [Acaulospora morrowiae]|uniref:13661_t:CDS:1 n=1 Tax=Acaulospora morrowiae TaxID=94023 RepID=A0A9N9FIY1_9GLOM|nr:13661_t:CDS:2 [Acaulospora morrowiae]